jgi:hypothetical protein
MNILSLVTGHHHYWGVPHVGGTEERLIQICYECGAQKRVKANLLPAQAPERNRSAAAASSSTVVEDRKAA